VPRRPVIGDTLSLLLDLLSKPDRRSLFERRSPINRRSLFERRSPINRRSWSDRVSMPLRRSLADRRSSLDRLSSLAIANSPLRKSPFLGVKVRPATKRKVKAMRDAATSCLRLRDKRT
jgi:hypothetical protein